MKIWNTSAIGIVVLPTLLLGGCILAPRGTQDEEAALKKAGAPYDRPAEQRYVPDLPAEPNWEDILRRAFLANGDLEAAYFEWAASVARVQQAGAWPNTPLSVGFEYMFSGGRMKSSRCRSSAPLSSPYSRAIWARVSRTAPPGIRGDMSPGPRDS